MEELLKIQENLKKIEPDTELISSDELSLIKMAWIYDGDDSESARTLFNMDNKDDPEERLLDRLLIVERDFSNISRRVGIYKKLEAVISEYSMCKMVDERNDN